MRTASAGERRGWVRRSAAYLGRHRADVLLAFGAAVVGSGCQAVVPLVERHIVDAVVARRGSLWPALTLLIVLAAVAFAAAYVRRYHGGRVALGVQYDLRNDMQAHLQRLDFGTLATMPTGQLVARANGDTALVQGLLSFLPIMSGNVLMMIVSLVVMVVLSPLLALVSVAIVPGLLVVSYRMRWKVFPASWDAQQREGDVAQIVDEAVTGVRVVKSFGQERRELRRLVEAAQTLYGAQMRTVRLQSRYQPVLQAIPQLGQVAILALGGWLVLHHSITVGTFLAFSVYVGQLLAPARQIAGLLTIGQQARAGVERIFQLLDTPSTITEAADAIELPASGPGAAGAVEFCDVRFGYLPGSDVVRGLDLRIAAGERVALVGASGSGKSTIAMLTARFYDPGSGSVRIDGHDVRALTLRSVRRAVAVAFEESFLFSDTVRANIAYGRPDASLDEIVAAARAARAHEFVEALPHGYDTVVGERGLTLSGGQRQRVALARALLCDARVLVLDDATSAVDATTEEAIHDAVRALTAGRTTLVVAHRRSTLHLADRVVVVDDGRVVDEGTHDELVWRSPHYRRLLAGLDQDEAAAIGDRIEALAVPRGGESVTLSAWQARPGGPDGRPHRARPGFGAPSIGAGLGRGGGGGWRMQLAPTPELMARVKALPAVRDHAVVDVATEATPDQRFTLSGLLRAFRRPLALGLLLVTLDALASLAGPVLVRTGIDSGVTVGAEGVLFAASGGYLLITLADLVDQIGETFVTGKTAQRVMLSLRVRIWAQLQRLSLDYYEREMAGRIMTRMTTDVDQFESLVQNGLLSALVALVTFVGVGVALLVMNPELGACTLAVVVPLAFATVAFRRRSVVLYDEARDRIAIANADFQESLSGVREAQAFAHEDDTIARFRRFGRNYLDARVAAQRLVAIYFPFVQFLSSVADAIVLGVGATMIAHGHLTAGALIAFILYVDLFFSPIQQLSQVFDAWQQTRVSMHRVAQLMREQPLTPLAVDPVRPGPLRGEVTLDEVHFAYPARDARPAGPVGERRGPADPRLAGVVAQRPAKPPEALRGISLRIDAGETVALVGETGAGKSTVMKLLIRFYDVDAGAVLVDGHDLRSLDIEGYRARLGYVPQEAFLFTGTVRDNIAYGRPDATDAEVEAAATAVGAHDMIAALPDGYLTELAERGQSLSSGQRQLIALARAQLVDPALLLLDEATSNLDLATEGRVTAAMERLAAGRTTIVIAHRLQTARRADRIAVLEGGRIIEVGSHEELIHRDGRYAEMWRAFETAGRPAA